MKSPNYPIGNGARNLPACSAVPQTRKAKQIDNRLLTALKVLTNKGDSNSESARNIELSGKFRTCMYSFTRWCSMVGFHAPVRLTPYGISFHYPFTRGWVGARASRNTLRTEKSPPTPEIETEFPCRTV